MANRYGTNARVAPGLDKAERIYMSRFLTASKVIPGTDRLAQRDVDCASGARDRPVLWGAAWSFPEVSR